MENIITGRIQVGNNVMISGRYKMDTPSAAHYLRTCDIYLEQVFTNVPTITATVHHVNTEAHPTKGNTVPFLISNIDLIQSNNQTRIMICSVETTAREIEYEYWCDYIVMGEK